MDEGGSTNGTSLSEEAQCGGPLGRAPLLRTLEDMLRKAPDTGISRHWSPTGTWYQKGGSYPGDFE
jgi:hypothetical protein